VGNWQKVPPPLHWLNEAVSASPVPHLDLERDIESGIREAKIAISQSEENSAGVASR